MVPLPFTEPMKPPRTGMRPAVTSGSRCARVASAIASGCGSALVKWSSVIITFRASMCVAGSPWRTKAATHRIDDSCSPNDATMSRLRGVASPRVLSASARWASSSQSALISEQASAHSSVDPSSASATSRWRARIPSTARTAPMRCPFDDCSPMAISAFVTPASAETTTIGLRSRRDATMDAVRLMASASPTEVPPNLRTITPNRLDRS